ncbi:Alcohol dehydrogenase superfamily, zinc-type [Cordyceps fumosorosea ARSEF 2679]|uniref:Alcohol dehydrogenase superfamily, zinc-type n=1 Tax=Cordyceps fumosorosea (strain ARSEF 2679) TaxID=1081104 RepID=A0A168BAW0_CORFA|nr:Alcohol dehydrogenase superfamily, zinc-type [Cordyceps fumosorosea ARSEF 2679]OAA69863.1 Alcohol dehydrogenase superfamily, zinc-type [Cordyceps fumosorosea ARSEF 2679]
MTMPTPTQGVEVADGIRRNWVRVAAPKNEQWTTAMDGLDKLKIVEAALPTPGDGEVLVRIDAVGGAFKSYDIQTDKAIVPCSDMCGTVIDAPHATTTTTTTFAGEKPWAVGDRVLAIYMQTHLSGPPREADLSSALGWPLPGVLARYRCFPASALVRAPAYLSAAEASCLPRAAAAAWTALPLLRGSSSYPPGPDDDKGGRTVLLQGTGAVALAGLQLAKAAGLRAVVTAPSDELVARAREELRADAGINHQTHWAWEGDVLEATGGRGADVIFDVGGARTLAKSFGCVAFGGRISCLDEGNGGEGGGKKEAPAPGLDVGRLALKRGVTVRGVLGGGREALREVLAYYEEHGIRPVVDGTVPFKRAGEALERVKKGGRFGTVVVTMEEEEDDKGGDGGDKKEEEEEEEESKA